MKPYISKSLLIALFVVSGLMLISCAKSEPTTTANHNANTPTTTAPAASPAATTATTAAAGEEIGIPECDAFLKAYEACVRDKVPAAVKPTFETSLTNWRKAWKQQAANPQAKAILASSCKTAREQSTAAMKAYNCAF